MNQKEELIAQIVRSVLEQKKASVSREFGTAAYRQPGADSSLQSGAFDNGGRKRSEVSRMTADITLDSAEALMKEVEAEAVRMGMKVVTAVADSHGNPVAVRCMDGAFIGSFDVALNKTYTSIAFQMSTEDLGKLSRPDGPLYGIQHTNQGRIVIFGGGVPLKIDGELIGAFGVSGGSAEQDTYLADFAEEAFRRMSGQ